MTGSPDPDATPVDYRTVSREDFAAELAKYGVKPTHEGAASGSSNTLADELAQYGLTTRPTR